MATGEDSVIAMYRMTSGVTATIAAACPGFELDPLARALFGDDGTQYELPGTTVDAALLAAHGSDLAVRSVRMDEVLDSTVSAYQDDIDTALGLG